MISSVLKEFSSMTILNEIDNFFTDREAGSAREAIKQSMSAIKAKIAYKEYILKDDWFKQKHN